jgi:hypothetical protein
LLAAGTLLSPENVKACDQLLLQCKATPTPQYPSP